MPICLFFRDGFCGDWGTPAWQFPNINRIQRTPPGERREIYSSIFLENSVSDTEHREQIFLPSRKKKKKEERREKREERREKREREKERKREREREEVGKNSFLLLFFVSFQTFFFVSSFSSCLPHLRPQQLQEEQSSSSREGKPLRLALRSVAACSLTRPTGEAGSRRRKKL